MRLLKIFTGVLLMLIQIALMYVDRFICAFIPWLPIKKVSTRLEPLNVILNSSIRVTVFILIYWYVKQF